MKEARLVFARLKENYDSTRDELKYMMETFTTLSGFHSRPHFNSKLSSLCNSKNRSFREAVVTIVCKTSAISSQDGKVGMKDTGIEERMLEFLYKNCSGSEEEEIHRRLNDDLIGPTDFASLAQSSMETGGTYSADNGYDEDDDAERSKNEKVSRNAMSVHTSSNTSKSLIDLMVGDRVEKLFSSGKWYGGVVTAVSRDKVSIDFDDGDKEKNIPKDHKMLRIQVSHQHASSVSAASAEQLKTAEEEEAVKLSPPEAVEGAYRGKDGDSNAVQSGCADYDYAIEGHRKEGGVYDELELKYGGINILEAKVKMQAEAISMMEASLKEGDWAGDVDPLDTSDVSNAYEDDFEASKSPEKTATLSNSGHKGENKFLMDKYQADKIEPYSAESEPLDKLKERKLSVPSKGTKALASMRKSLSKESATSDILSMADKLLDGDHDDILGFNDHLEPGIGGAKKTKKKKKMTRKAEDSQKTSISRQHALDNDTKDAKIVNKLRKVVKSSSAPDSLSGSQKDRQGRLRPIEENITRLEKAVAMKDLGAVDLLKILREKSSSALEILFRANNILNNKLNSAYKIALKDLQERQRQEIERLDAEAEIAGEENMINARSLTVEKSKKANSKHRVDVYRCRLKEKHQLEADGIWESLQAPMKNLDDVYGDQVQRIKAATDRAASVGKRSVELMEKYSRDSKLRDKAKLLDKLNNQTRKAVFDSCQVIADICGNVKHVYTSLSDSLFTSDGGIIGLNVGGWQSKTIRTSVSPPPSPPKPQRMDGPSASRSPKGNVIINDKAHYEENEDPSRILSPNHSPSVLDNFNKALDIEITQTVGPRSPKPPSPSYISAVKGAMVATTSVLSPGSDYDDDFEGEESPSKKENISPKHSPTKKFLDSLSKSSGLKPAENILEASGEYEDDFEENSPLRYEHVMKSKSPKQVESDGEFQGDYVSECERLGIDPNSSWRLLDRRADRANPNLNKKKRKKGKGEKKGKEDVKGISTTSLSQCYQCKKM